ncbi:MAG TPA: phage holin family protein [Acidimicrobiales bacterium]|nr:phage holin family protein [Acidimicrobiales bacterium]
MTANHYADPPVDDRPLGELFSEMTSQVQDLLRKEVELAKLETKDQVSKATKAGALLAAAGVAGFFAALLLAFAAAWGLAEAIPTGLAFLAVGLLFAVIGGLMATAGRKKLASFKPVPEQTIKTLRDDVEVAKGSLSRGASTTPSRPMTRSWNG